MNGAVLDLGADPGEIRNLADGPAHTETPERLLKHVLAGWDPGTIRNECVDREKDYKSKTKCGYYEP